MPFFAELLLWSTSETAADGGGPDADTAFAAIKRWGASIDDARSEARVVARELKIEDRFDVEFAEDERAIVGVAIAAWNPAARTLLLSRSRWADAPGWKRREAVAHQIMHARQTIAGPAATRVAWDEMTRLEAAAAQPGLSPDEALRRQWSHRHHPLEAEALHFGRAYRDRLRAVKPVAAGQLSPSPA